MEVAPPPENWVNEQLKIVEKTIENWSESKREAAGLSPSTKPETSERSGEEGTLHE